MFWRSQHVPGLGMRLVFQGFDHLIFDHLVYLFQDNEHLSVAVATLIFPVWVSMRCPVVESPIVESYLDD